MSRRAVLAVLALAALALGLTGCGLGAGSGATGVALTVTRDYGTHVLGEHRTEQTAGSETVLRLLERSFDVKTRYGGGFVQAIDGLAGGTSGGRPVDWFFYVNGIESGNGSASVRLHAGDRVWWDWHDWGSVMRVPAVVGSFPEPLRSGHGGRRMPVVIDCAAGADAVCAVVQDQLERVDVPTSSTLLGEPARPGALRVVVGPWREVREDPAAVLIGGGPRHSGVYARPAADGAHIALLDPRERTVRTLGAGSGLVAATRKGNQSPTWVVTGTDMAGALAAAHALTPRALHARFAVAVSGDDVLSLPLEPGA